MIFQSVEFIHLRLPFNTAFEHARVAREYGDTILVKVTTSDGVTGWGEILPRPYVTGESVEKILDKKSKEPIELVRLLSGLKIIDQYELEQWIDAYLPQYRNHTALFGGLELAMWDSLTQSHGVNWDKAIGPVNTRELGRCVTVGFDAATDKLRARAIDAKLKKASVVKLKIGLDDDVERIKLLDQHLRGKIPIRVDANGLYDIDRLESLLATCAETTNLQSVEQPFTHTDDSYVDLLLSLYKKYKIPFVADESVCSVEDANKWRNSGGFQIFNLRIGKHGGFRATKKIRDLANESGIGLVSGSMVGESAILNQASELMLERSMGYDYVEGLGLNRSFLVTDPVEKVDGDDALLTFELKDHTVNNFIHDSRTINCQCEL